MAALVVAAVGIALKAAWLYVLMLALGTFGIVMFSALFIIRKYVAYKLKPIYSIVLSRDVHTTEILDELKDKRVENIGEELTAWADTNDKGDRASEGVGALPQSSTSAMWPTS